MNTDELNINVSTSTTDRALEKFHYSLKVLNELPIQRNSEMTLNKRKIYPLLNPIENILSK